MAERLRPSDRVKAEAAHWVALLRSDAVDLKVQTEFERWLKTSPAHAASFSAAEATYRALDKVPELQEMDVDAIISEAQAAETAETSTAPTQRLRKAGPAMGAAAAVAASIVFVVSVLIPALAPNTPDVFANAETIETATAELRDVTLEDGTVVTIGARTALKTAFTEDARRVALSEGEAFFVVAKDASRPFFVEAGDAVIRVVGTEFDVKHGLDDVFVTVREGVVAVAHAGAVGRKRTVKAMEAAPMRTLTAGQQLVVAGTLKDANALLPEPATVDVTTAGSWREGMLFYDDVRLEQVIADANRYSARPIELASPGLDDLRVVGAFPIDRIDGMLDGLEGTQPVLVDRSNPEKIVVRRDYTR